MCRENLEIDEFSNAFDYLQKAHFYLHHQDDMYWAKWVSLSLSDALYHFMLCALGHQDPRKIIDYDGRRLNKTEREIFDSLPVNCTEEEKDKYDQIVDNYINSGRGKVITFQEALKRIQHRKNLPHLTFVEDVILSSDEIYRAEELRQSFRNKFQHFENMSWEINLQVLKPFFKATISIIDKLFESQSLFVFNNKPQYNNLKVLIEDITNSVEEM